ncbi:hypothetical protein ACLOJK_038244 [Asimina triloba]
MSSVEAVRSKTKFSSLLHFACNVVVDDEMKNQKFEDGSVEGIRGRIISFQCLTYGEFIKRALWVENDIKELRRLFEKRKGVMEGEELALKK